MCVCVCVCAYFKQKGDISTLKVSLKNKNLLLRILW